MALDFLGLPLGRLPGDVRVRGEGWAFYFPIVTCIVVSIVLSVLTNSMGTSDYVSSGSPRNWSQRRWKRLS